MVFHISSSYDHIIRFIYREFQGGFPTPSND